MTDNNFFTANPWEDTVSPEQVQKMEREHYQRVQAEAEAREEQKRQAAAEFMRYGEWGQPPDGLTDEEFERLGKEYNAQQLQKRRNEVGTENANRLLAEHPDLLVSPANAEMFKEFMKAKGLDETNYDDVQYAYSQLQPKLLHRDPAGNEFRRRAIHESQQIGRRAFTQIDRDKLDELSDEQFANIGRTLGYDVPGGAW